MKKLLWFVAFTLVGVGLEPAATENDEVPFHDAYLTLKAENPNVSDECLVVAANVMIGNYEGISDMMQTKHGRCATRVLGLIVRLDVNGNIK